MRDRRALLATHDGSIAPRADDCEDLCSHVRQPRGRNNRPKSKRYAIRIVGITVGDTGEHAPGCRETVHISTRNGMPTFFGRRLYVR